MREEFQDNLSEWLRRQTRNLLGFARAGSNPAVVVFYFTLLCNSLIYNYVILNTYLCILLLLLVVVVDMW